MADLTAHEKFLRGEPISPELRALRDGGSAPSLVDPAPSERKAFDDPTRKLSRSERLDLKEMQEMPGWKLFLRIAERTIFFHEKQAISVSRNNPLRNKEEVSEMWAYHSMLRRAISELESVVNAEVDELGEAQ